MSARLRCCGALQGVTNKSLLEDRNQIGNAQPSYLRILLSDQSLSRSLQVVRASLIDGLSGRRSLPSLWFMRSVLVKRYWKTAPSSNGGFSQVEVTAENAETPVLQHSLTCIHEGQLPQRQLWLTCPCLDDRQSRESESECSFSCGPRLECRPCLPGLSRCRVESRLVTTDGQFSALQSHLTGSRNRHLIAFCVCPQRERRGVRRRDGQRKRQRRRERERRRERKQIMQDRERREEQQGTDNRAETRREEGWREAGVCVHLWV